MHYIALVCVLALVEYFVFGFLVGRARVRTGIAAPAISGDPIFERYMRVHQNTLEQLIVFLPAIYIFGRFVHAPVGALLGVVFIIGRFLYFRGYIADPEKRSRGALVTGLVQVILLLCGGVGAALRAF